MKKCLFLLFLLWGLAAAQNSTSIPYTENGSKSPESVEKMEAELEQQQQVMEGKSSEESSSSSEEDSDGYGGRVKPLSEPILFPNDNQFGSTAEEEGQMSSAEDNDQDPFSETGLSAAFLEKEEGSSEEGNDDPFLKLLEQNSSEEGEEVSASAEEEPPKKKKKKHHHHHHHHHDDQQGSRGHHHHQHGQCHGKDKHKRGPLPSFLLSMVLRRLFEGVLGGGLSPAATSRVSPMFPLIINNNNIREEPAAKSQDDEGLELYMMGMGDLHESQKQQNGIGHDGVGGPFGGLSGLFRAMGGRGPPSAGGPIAGNPKQQEHHHYEAFFGGPPPLPPFGLFSALQQQPPAQGQQNGGPQQVAAQQQQQLGQQGHQQQSHSASPQQFGQLPPGLAGDALQAPPFGGPLPAPLPAFGGFGQNGGGAGAGSLPPSSPFGQLPVGGAPQRPFRGPPQFKAFGGGPFGLNNGGMGAVAGEGGGATQKQQASSSNNQQ